MEPNEAQDGRLAVNHLALMLGVDANELGSMSPKVAQLVTAHLNRSNRRIKGLVDGSAIDDLTGALRRRPGLDALERELQRALRMGDHHLVVAFLDVDGLKSVNDHQGHLAGDQLLREVGESLRANLRVYDLVIRYGGDEFVCVLPMAGLEGAERIVNEIGTSISVKTGRTFSAGLVELSEILDASPTASELIRRADMNLYAARAAAKTRPSWENRLEA